jgi:membrane fusion protein, multidrug efflux system
MKPMSLLVAAVVVAVLYLLVLQRDTLLAFASRGEAPVPVVAEAAIRDASADAAGDAAEGRIRVVALRSEARPIDRAVVMRGETQAVREVEVRAETSGQVVSAPIRAGASVAEGDLLCRIAPGTREAQLGEARARLMQARAGLPEADARVAEARARLDEAEIADRAASRLVEEGFASQTRVAGARAAVESARAGVQSALSGLEAAGAAVSAAEAAIAAAETEIERLEIRAPFAGLLETDTAELGSLLQPGALCATVIQLDPVKLVGFVPETAVARIEVGAPAGGRLTSGQEVVGQVTFLSRSADPTTRTFRVEIEVANPDLAISDGQTVEIAVASDGTDAHLLPQSALTLDDGGQIGVRVVTPDDTVAFVPISILRDTERGIWVDGLGETADVIVVGQEFVTDGVAVAATFQEATP